jgi:hypothetical protein
MMETQTATAVGAIARQGERFQRVREEIGSGERGTDPRLTDWRRKAFQNQTWWVALARAGGGGAKCVTRPRIPRIVARRANRCPGVCSRSVGRAVCLSLFDLLAQSPRRHLSVCRTRSEAAAASDSLSSNSNALYEYENQRRVHSFSHSLSHQCLPAPSSSSMSGPPPPDDKRSIMRHTLCIWLALCM